MRVLCFVLAFLLLLSTGSQASAQGGERQPFKVTTVKKPGGITQYFAKRPWEGLFAAKKFGRNDQQKLENIQATLQASLLELPTTHTQALKELEVRNTKHVSRGLANSRMMILNADSISTKEELQAVFTHEMGHIVDLGMLSTTSRTKTDFWTQGTQVFTLDPSLGFYKLSWEDHKQKKPGVTRRDFVSGYAMASPFEDFAESYLFYRLHGEKFRSIASDSNILAAKYKFMKEQVFQNQEFQLQKTDKGFLHNLIWDATLVKL